MTPPLEDDDRKAPGTSRRARVEDALGRAALHGRRAALEAVTALRAVLEAAGIAAGLDERAVFARLDSLLAELGALASDGDVGGPATDVVLESLLGALDREIDRWEERSREDPDARAVLRAFLGMRELCWELGLRPRPSTHEEPRTRADAASAGARDAAPQKRARARRAAGSRAQPGAERRESETQQVPKPPPPRPRVRRVDVEG